MKVCMVTQSYYPKPGGVSEVVHHTARELRARGHEATIITTSYNGKEEEERGVIRIGRNLLLPVNGAWVNVTAGIGLEGRLKEIFSRGAFDIVQTHCPLVPTLPLLALKAVERDQNIIGTFHAAAESNIGYSVFRKPLGKLARRLNHRIAVSGSALRFASRYFPGRYEIVPNGIDCKRFHPGVPPIKHLKDDRLNVLYVGRMDKRKGLPYLFRALPIAQRKFSGNIRLILVGEGKLRKMFIPKPVRFHGAEIVTVGRVDPEILPRYYTTADIFCSPATGRESFGIVLLEAVASGVPVVASEIPGYKDVISHGREGYLVPPRNPEAIAEAIVELGENASLRTSLGMRGREKALTYDWPVVVDMLEQIFYRALGIETEKKAPESIRHNVG